MLPPFDEYLVAYRDRDSVLKPRHVKSINAGGGMLGPSVLIDGTVVGTWRRELKRSTVAVEIRMFERASQSKRRPIESAARQYAAFLGLDAAVRFY